MKGRDGVGAGLGSAHAIAIVKYPGGVLVVSSKELTGYPGERYTHGLIYRNHHRHGHHHGYLSRWTKLRS